MSYVPPVNPQFTWQGETAYESPTSLQFTFQQTAAGTLRMPGLFLRAVGTPESVRNPFTGTVFTPATGEGSQLVRLAPATGEAAGQFVQFVPATSEAVNQLVRFTPAATEYVALTVAGIARQRVAQEWPCVLRPQDAVAKQLAAPAIWRRKVGKPEKISVYDGRIGGCGWGLCKRSLARSPWDDEQMRVLVAARMNGIHARAVGRARLQ